MLEADTSSKPQINEVRAVWSAWVTKPAEVLQLDTSSLRKLGFRPLSPVKSMGEIGFSDVLTQEASCDGIPEGQCSVRGFGTDVMMLTNNGHVSCFVGYQNGKHVYNYGEYCGGKVSGKEEQGTRKCARDLGKGSTTLTYVDKPAPCPDGYIESELLPLNSSDQKQDNPVSENDADTAGSWFLCLGGIVVIISGLAMLVASGRKKLSNSMDADNAAFNESMRTRQEREAREKEEKLKREKAAKAYQQQKREEKGITAEHYRTGVPRQFIRGVKKIDTKGLPGKVPGLHDKDIPDNWKPPRIPPPSRLGDWDPQDPFNTWDSGGPSDESPNPYGDLPGSGNSPRNPPHPDSGRGSRRRPPRGGGGRGGGELVPVKTRNNNDRRN